MSDHQNSSNEATGATEGPASKKPCLIETPPVHGTPDTGSDFYGTPLAGATPAMSTTGVTIEKDAGDIPVPSKPSNVIPGLNLIHHPSEQANGSPPTEHTTQQEQDKPVQKEEDLGTETKQDQNQHVSQPEPSEVVMKDEPEAIKIEHEATAAPAESMEVEQNTHQDNMIEAAAKGEDGEEEEHPEWEVDSSPYESSSDSSDSSDSDDSDDEDYPILSAEEQARILMLAEGGSDDEGDGKGKSGGHLRTTNEIEQEILPVPDVKITPEMNIVFLGKVHAAIDNNVLVEANTSGEYQVLESGSLLCSDDRQVIGVVAETLGRVENPLYTIAYATAAEVQEKGLVKGKDIFYVEGHSTFVFTQPLKGMKGSDASNFHDEEVADEEMEFSDDEAEAEYKRKLKQKRQERKEAREGPRGKKPAPGPSKLNQSELNYDDAGGEEGYTPLARPTNLHEMMSSREPPVEGNERGGFRGGRGRGRGDRGRGGRGRGGRGGREWEQDRRPQQGNSSSYEAQPQAQAQAQPQPQPQAQPTPYGQPMYQQQPQYPYGMAQPFAAYAQYAQQQAQNPQLQQQQPQFGQNGGLAQMPFQFPNLQGLQQMQPMMFQNPSQGANQFTPQHLAILQQQQQQLLQLARTQPMQHFAQPQHPHYQQPQQQAPPQAQTPAMNFDQVKAQLDLLRNLSGGNQGPPPS
ncbi:Translation elongation/initiation factor/Ribosomal beta-barrel [Penicillium paradoxum]|uniref:Translation elongation/initiation factor/Ribosomal beta-barrel n=1 Tax=Penicillium paradoxum TaxID=176176 RepID=UPI002549189B|nr:Translation elongation/initiation factor/Ribosomal beta-barrel [Penicillium paradoxum]KAJ5774843.1 Translation elongation/initiation factor/Ribosomal beta-barrel [Penicillium paradoxum]